jgi:hypothetical protein
MADPFIANGPLDTTRGGAAVCDETIRAAARRSYEKA